jgi:hypothetical protein
VAVDGQGRRAESRGTQLSHRAKKLVRRRLDDHLGGGEGVHRKLQVGAP